MKGKFLQVSGLALIVLLSACANQNSAERHARSYIYKSKDDFDPNFRTDISSSVKLMTPTFENFYQEGKKDRAAGLSLAEATTKTEQVMNDKCNTHFERHYIFMGKKYAMSSDVKQQRLLIKEGIDTYWDGYYNR